MKPRKFFFFCLAVLGLFNIPELLLPAVIEDRNVIDDEQLSAVQFKEKGDVKYKAEDYAGALKYYDKAVKTNNDPKNNFYIFRAIAKLSLKDFPGALKDLNNSIMVTPDFAPQYASRGSIKMVLNDFEGAIRDLDKSIEMGNSNATVFAIRGGVRFLHGEKNEGIQDCEKALGMDPKCALANTYLGYIYFEQVDYDRAEENFKKAFGASPNKELKKSICSGLAITYLRKHDLVLAKEYYGKAIALDERYAGRIDELLKDGNIFTPAERKAVDEIIKLMGY